MKGLFFSLLAVPLLVVSCWGKEAGGPPLQNSDILIQRTVSARRLGSFDELNELFEGARINLPDANLEGDGPLFTTYRVDLTNLFCENVSIDDILIDYSLDSNQRFSFRLKVVGLVVDCQSDYSYRWTAFRGDGRMKAYTRNNSANTTLVFTSPNFQTEPPSNSFVDSCLSQIDIYNIDFSRGIVARILDLAERSVKSFLEGQIEKVLCDEFSTLGTSFIEDAMAYARTEIDKYLVPVTPDRADPLSLEKTIALPTDVDLLDFRGLDNTIGSWVSDVFEQADDFFGSVDGNGELSINEIVREMFLQDGKLTLRLEDLPFLNFDPELFKSHDLLTETVVTMKGASIYGLDTFTVFQPIQALGNYTVGTNFRWRELTVDLELEVDIRPSSRPDSILENPDLSKRIIENIIVSTGVDDVKVSAGLFAGIDQTKLGDLMFGSLLFSENLLACISSVMHRLEITNFDVEVGNIREPVLTGFLSPGIDRLVTDAFEAIFIMYEKTFLKAIPGIFQGPVRDILQQDIIEASLLDPQKTQCPEPVVDGTIVDFRDLLLKGDESTNVLGTGSEPYGDVPVLLYDQLRRRLLEPEDGALPPINEIVIRPFTKSQSGTEGLFRLQDDIISVSMENLRPELLPSLIGLNFSVADLRIDNIDTVTSPIDILKPTYSPWILKNLVKWSSNSNSPLSVAFRTFFLLNTGGSPLGFDDEFDVKLSVNSFDVEANLLIPIVADRMRELPMRHVLNPYCWLAMIRGASLDSDGLLLNDPNIPGISLTLFQSVLRELNISVDCVNCTSPGILSVNDVLDTIADSGAVSLLGDRLVDFAEEILVGPFTETLLNRFINDSRLNCPIYDEYTPDVNRTIYDFPSLGGLSEKAIDTFIYGASLAAEVGFVVFSKNFVAHDAVQSSSFLASQDRFSAPDNVELIDWTDLFDLFGLGNLPTNLLDSIGSFLSEVEGTGELRVNNLVREFLPEDKMIRIDLDGASWLLDDINVTMTQVKIMGLDSFTQVNVLKPLAPQTLGFNVSLSNIHAELDLIFDSISTPDDPVEVTISVGANNASISTAIFIAINEEQLGSLTLGSLLDTSSLLECILSTIYHVEFPRIDFNVQDIETPKFTGMKEDTDQAVQESIRSLLSVYSADIINALPVIVDTTIKEIINQWLESEIGSHGCSSVGSDVSTAYVDFRDLFLPQSETRRLDESVGSPYGDLFQKAKVLLNDRLLEIDPDTGSASINSFIVAPLTEAQSDESGKLSFEGDLFDQSTRIDVGGLRADVKLRAFDAYVDNMDSVGAPFSVLDPVRQDAHLLNNTASIGVGKSIKLGTKFEFQIAGDDTTIRNTLDINLGLDTLTLILSFLLKLSADDFLSLPLKAVPNIDCWLAMVPTTILDEYGVREDSSERFIGVDKVTALVSSIGLNVSCIECSSPGMIEWTELLATEEAQSDVTDVANDIFDYATSFLEGSFAQVFLDRMVNDSRLKCPFSPEYDEAFVSSSYQPFPVEENEPSIKFFVLVGIVGGAFALAVVTVTLLVKLIVRRRNLRWIKSLPDVKLYRVYRRQQEAKAKEDRLNRASGSLYSSKVIPFWIRILIPLIILGNIALFLSGHLSLGGTVAIQATIADQSLKVDSFFEFSIAKSTVEIWNAGGRELAIMILIFSVIWPYTKQIITLILWFLPPSRCSISKRGSILLWLDALAKWSIIDIFTLVITIAGFRISIKSPDVAFLPEDFYSIDLLVVPLWGLYANMIAQLVSQISSHVIIHYHRRVYDAAKEETEEKGTDLSSTFELERTALCDHKFSRPHRGEQDRLVRRNGTNIALQVISLGLISLVIVGCVVPSFSLEVLGIIGIFVESGQRFNQARTEHTLFSIVRMLFDQARFTGRIQDFIGLGSLSTLLLLTVLFVPIVQALLLLVQWMKPMDMKVRRKLSVAVEMLQSWQYAEVYLLALLVASWQLGQISDFMINSYCENLDVFFGNLVFYGFLEEQDAQCFRVESRIESASYFLASAAVLLAFLNTFIMKAVGQYFREKEAAEEGVFAELPDIPDGCGDLQEIQKMITPVPILFTDRFRWFMKGSPEALPSNEKTNGTVSAAFVSEEDEIDLDECEFVKVLATDTSYDNGEDPAFIGDAEDLSVPGHARTDDSSEEDKREALP